MRKFALLLILALGLSAFSQSQGPDIRLKERFSESQINKMDQHRLAYWTFYLDNSFSIMDIPSEKAEYLKNLEEIEVDLSGFHGFTMILDPY
ncbi:MAG: hypothetical protein HKO93_00965, partial [Flavobacteriales bacterium]|nr:hypothetical protein [Flavobacteriales bacterium]